MKKSQLFTALLLLFFVAISCEDKAESPEQLTLDEIKTEVESRGFTFSQNTMGIAEFISVDSEQELLSQVSEKELIVKVRPEPIDDDTKLIEDQLDARKKKVTAPGCMNQTSNYERKIKFDTDWNMGEAELVYLITVRDGKYNIRTEVRGNATLLTHTVDFPDFTPTKLPNGDLEFNVGGTIWWGYKTNETTWAFGADTKSKILIDCNGNITGHPIYL